ncbi:NTP transferase domain-containing protein [Allosphingosinicella sp.]|uniref:NTP transferase domain-containing protein n=1 Tax=Allosphingosinicella sp. TaxID=2823234 RepID=UPI002FC1AECE
METRAQWTAIILAGRRPGEDGFAAANGVAAKALIQVGGMPMLGRVARTVLETPSIARAIVLSQDPDALLTGALQWLADDPRVATALAEDGISASVMAVAGSEAAPWPVLVVTADHALLSSAMIEEFLEAARGEDAAAAVVERRTVEASYPETRRTWLRFSDGDYTGANMFALGGPQSREALAAWSGVERDRKKARRLLMRFGFFLALRAATRSISLDGFVSTMALRLGIRLRAVRLADAEAAIDVDKADDLRLVEAILARS